MSENKFALMVVGKQNPSVLHETFKDAELEAIRLAKSERRDVYILKVVAKAELNDIKLTYYED